ncbi:MAG: hypothetical protein J5992_09900 [Oscillospiraceae bacterium]|nr:hypothetical protein [Oscillospiraceae bacterium]
MNFSTERKKPRPLMTAEGIVRIRKTSLVLVDKRGFFFGDGSLNIDELLFVGCGFGYMVGLR